MRVERRDLIDLGKGQLHLGGERSEMSSREVSVLILNEMKMLDQQIAPAWPIGQERANFHHRLRINLAALRCTRRATPAAAAGRSSRADLFRNAHLSLSKHQTTASGPASTSPSPKLTDRPSLSAGSLPLFFLIVVRNRIIRSMRGSVWEFTAQCRFRRIGA